MAQLNFPDPSVTQIYTEAGITWTWNNTLGVWSTETETVIHPPEPIGDGRLTIKDYDGNELGSFTANQSSDNTITLPQIDNNITSDIVSVKSFGAKGDGSTDDTVAIQAAFDSISDSGETLHFPAGTYMVSNMITIRLRSTTNPVKTGCKVDCSENTTIKATSSFPQNTKFIQVLVKDTNRDHTFIWNGGTIDGTSMPQRTGGAPDLMSVGEGDVLAGGGGSLKRTGIYNVDFICNIPNYSNGGAPPALGNAGDSCLFLAKGENFHVENCRFIGPTDAGIYVSGDNNIDVNAHNLFINNCTFSHCPEVAFISKRLFKNNIITNNSFERCRIGVAQGAVGDAGTRTGAGFRVLVANNIFTDCRDTAIEIRQSRNSIVSNNIIENIGFEINANNTQGSTVSNNYECYGIHIAGSSRCVVNNNVIFIDTTRGFTTGSKAFGIFLGGRDADKSNYTLVNGNSISHIPTGIAEDPDQTDSLYNILANNQINNASDDIKYTHNGSYFSDVNLEDGHIVSGWGPDEIWKINRNRPGRPGSAYLDVPLTVNGSVNSSNSRVMNNALAKIALAADDQGSTLQEFKNAIIEALSDITLEEG